MSYNKDTNMYEGYIYKIQNNINDKIYIGQTRTDIKNRWRQHKYESKIINNKSSIIHKAIHKYGISHFEIILLYSLSAKTKVKLQDLLNQYEIETINKENSLVPNGYNISKGGSNAINYSHPVVSYYIDGFIDKEYDSISDAALDVNGNSGVIYKCCIGKHQYAYHRVWRYKDDKFDKYPLTISEKQIAHYKGETSPVIQYDKNTKQELNRFNSIKEACEYMNYDYPRESYRIANMCRGLVTSDVSEYVWRYLGDDFDKYRHHNAKCKKVDMYDLNGNFIKTFDSFIDGSMYAYQFDNTSSMQKNCKGKINRTGNYIWRYHGDSLNKYKYKIIRIKKPDGDLSDSGERSRGKSENG